MATAKSVGFKALTEGHAIPCRDDRAAAEALLAARAKGAPCRIRARSTLSRDRDLTADEGAAIVALAVGMAS